MSPSWFVAALASILSAAASPGAATDALEVTHRRSQLTIDGEVEDWQGAPAVEIVPPAAAGEPTTRASVRWAWDQRELWVLFEVQDPTLHLAPAEVSGPALFQWDSVEIYVDGRGDRASRMGVDDFQFILAPDGRTAALQGDPLLFELEGMAVPKRERPALAIAAAGRLRAGGYAVECAIPWAALGVAPHTGLALALDLAFNDWTADHPRLDQLAYDLETIHKLERSVADSEPVFTRHGLARARAEKIEREHYRPWAWSGSADFGFPRRWHAVRLVGSPPLAERLVESLGAGRTLAAGGAATALLLVAVVAGTEWRHRRRMTALLARLGAIDATSSTSEGAPEQPAAAPGADPSDLGAPARPVPPVSLEWLERAAEREVESDRSDRFELRAVRVIRHRLAAALAPADLAEALFVSLRTLERHLEATLACTPRELILAVKMREARRLLESGDWQVQEVARRVGYDDPSHFSRRFKAYFGSSPAAAAARASATGARQPAA